MRNRKVVSEESTNLNVVEDAWIALFRFMDTKELMALASTCTDYYCLVSASARLWQTKFLAEATEDDTLGTLSDIEDRYLQGFNSEIAWKWRWIFHYLKTFQCRRVVRLVEDILGQLDEEDNADPSF